MLVPHEPVPEPYPDDGWEYIHSSPAVSDVEARRANSVDGSMPGLTDPDEHSNPSEWSDDSVCEEGDVHEPVPDPNPDDGWEYIHSSPAVSDVEARRANSVDGSMPGLSDDDDLTEDDEHSNPSEWEADSECEEGGGLLMIPREDEGDEEAYVLRESDGESEGGAPGVESVRDSGSDGAGASGCESEGSDMPPLHSDSGSDSEAEAADVQMRPAETASRSLRPDELGFWHQPAATATPRVRGSPFRFPGGGEPPERSARHRSSFQFPAGGGRKRSAPAPGGDTSEEAVSPRAAGHARRRRRSGQTPSPTRPTGDGGRKGNVKSAEKNEDLVDDVKFMNSFRQISLCDTCPHQPLGGIGMLMHVVHSSRVQYVNLCPTDQSKKAFLMTHMRASPHQVVEPCPDGLLKMWRWPGGINVQGHPTPDDQHKWCVRCFRILFEVRVVRIQTH